MTDSRVASDVDPAEAPVSWLRATFTRWFSDLNTFLERAFRTADVETGC